MKIKRKKLTLLLGLAGLFCVSSPIDANNKTDGLEPPAGSAFTVSIPGGVGRPAYINLVDPDTRWESGISKQRAEYVRRKGVVATGPFIIDTSHRESGLMIAPLVIAVNRNADIPEHRTSKLIDLRNGEISFELKFNNKAQGERLDPTSGGRLLFWFQARSKRKAVAGGKYSMPTRMLNYVQTQNLMDAARSGDKISIRITPDLNQWSCLGKDPLDLRPEYGSAASQTCALNHAEFSEAMANPISIGFVLLLPTISSDQKDIAWLSSASPHRTAVMAGSSFELRTFSISTNDQPSVISRNAPAAATARQSARAAQ